MPDGLVAIQLCSSPPAGSLGYPVVAHEVGHILSYKRQLVYELISEPTLTNVWDELVKERNVELTAIARQWLEEWLCDAIGAFLMGPAFSFASLAFSPSLVKDIRPLVIPHPPWQARHPMILSTILDETDGLGYKSLEPLEVNQEKVDVAEILRSWQALIQQSASPLPPEKHALYERLKPFHKPIIELARQQCGPHIYGPEKFGPEVSALVGRLTNNILPNEVEIWNDLESRWEFKIPTLPGILNAAWVYQLSSESQFSLEHVVDKLEGEVTLERDITRFARMISRAVELAEVKRSWSS